MPSINESLLPDAEWNKLQEFADRFADARRAGPVDFWDDYLPPESGRLYRPTLVEIVKIDLEMSWRGGRKPTIDSYVQKYPELEPVPVDLILEEYRVRQASGEKPPLEEYLSRFPAQFKEFSERVKKLPAPKAPPPQSPATDTQHKGTGTVRKEAAPPPADKADGPVCPDGYKLIELLGRGNFADVWKAEAPGGVEVALKIVTQALDQEAAQREKQSLDLVKKLQHPTLAGVVAYWTINNRLVIGMELADKTLRDRLKECQQQGLPGIPAAELMSYFRDAAQGLDYLHSQGVIHRDIKPENILLKKGYAKVADFGLAKAQLREIATGSFAGTPAFMAPEIWGGKVGKASDQYSLAFTYAELRLGRRPLKGEGFAQVMESTLTAVPDLGDVPQPEANVLRKALAKRPEERFASCLEFVKALERACGVASVERGTVDSGPRPAAAPAAPSSPTPIKLSSSKVPVERAKSAAVPPATPSPVQQSIAIPPALQPSIATPAPSRPSSPTPRPVQNWKAPAQSAQPPPKAPASAQRSWSSPRSKPQGGGKGAAIALGVLVVAGVGAGIAIWKWPTGNPSSSTAPATTAQSPTAPQRTTSVQPTKPLPPTTKPQPPITADPDKPVLPGRRFQAAPGAQVVSVGGKKVYDKLTVPVTGELPATFLLLRPNGAGEPKPFYLLEYKAWNALVQDFLKENPGAIDAKWKGGPATLPAMNLTFEEADRVAKWFGGRIPSAAEWDFAAGFTRRTAGAALGKSLAVARDAPLPVDADPGDVSPLRVRNVAGNGREFTSDTLTAGSEKMVVLRGRMFTLSRPLSYDDLAAEQNDEAKQTQYPTARSPQTGFRIVVDVP